jgi:hypothetical protein
VSQFSSISSKWHVLNKIRPGRRWGKLYQNLKVDILSLDLNEVEIPQQFFLILTDFVILEGLLNLLARLIPSATSNKAKHSQFLREVFLQPCFDKGTCGKNIFDILENKSTKVWEDLSAKVVDALAESDIAL